MENVSSRCGKSDNAPRLRFPEFSGEWLSTTLGAIGTFTKGAPLSKADIASEGTPFILYGELYTTYKEVTTEIKRRTLKTANDECMSRVEDVIIPTSGETPDEIATATCIMVSNVILAGDLNIYRNSTIDGRFISYIINHVINGDISRIAQGKSVVHIKASELAKLRINYPSRQEQNKIIDFLMLLNRKIAKQQSLINALKTYKRGLLCTLLSEISESV
ncbi:restriction endonuclease subunit S, partial [Treponema sp.]|uniref:restriction endonuclease subunit S n=1 Tax=Treponema sp. TaxID=166 RepID=UPI003F0E17FC